MVDMIGKREVEELRRVLIINDSRFERLFLKDLLTDLGFEAHATDEYGFLRQLESLPPAIVIVNYTMSGVTGDKLITRIKKTHPFVKCLLSSCSDLNPGHYPQVDGILHTPADREALSRMLSAILPQEEAKAESAAAQDKPPAEAAYQFCPFCGQRLHQHGGDMVFCPYCGHKLA